MRMICLLFLLLLGCSQPTPEKNVRVAHRTMEELLVGLKKIETRDELLANQEKLKALFLRLAEEILVAREYLYHHPEERAPDITEENERLSLALQQEIKRLSLLRGGEKILKKCEEEAVTRLFLYKNKK